MENIALVQNNVFGKKVKISPAVVKGVIVGGLLLVASILLLFMPIITAEDNSIDLAVDISGLSIIIALFSGLKFDFTNNVVGSGSINLPLIPGIMLTIFVLLSLCLAIVTAVLFIAKKTDAKPLPYIYFGFVGALVVFYCVMIFSPKMMCEDFYGQEVAFYKMYSPGVNLLISMLIIMLAGFIGISLKPERVDKVKKYWVIYVILIVPTVLIAIFSLYPIFLQTVLSFKEYVIADGIWKSQWVGFANFARIFTDPVMVNVVLNTLLISVFRIIIQTIPPIILAIFLFDMGRNRYRKVVQTIIYIPHFFSWVIIYAISYAFINPEGIVNNIITALGGTPIDFLNREDLFIPILLITDFWKECGWGTIIYLAALSGVDPSLYEAAAVDGAGPMKKLFKITLPSIAPTIVFLSIMSVGNILKGAGGEQILLFGSEKMPIAHVIDTWLVWQGLNGLQYGLGSAVSFLQAGIGIILVLSCNAASKKFVGIGMW